MEEIRPQIRISVRDLVEFILRSGDLDNRTGTKSDLEAMQAGGTAPPEDSTADGRTLYRRSKS